MQKKIIPAIVFLCLSIFSYAQGDLLITPTRVVFEGNKQKEELNLVNVGGDTAIYSASFVQYKMNEDGGFIQIDSQDTSMMYADPYLRIFPRRVTLAPREPQVIMLQLRRRSDMKDGEYRSHLYFRAEKDITPLGNEPAGEDTTQLRVQLIPVFGLSIPVIIRSGSVRVQATLSDLHLEYEQDTIPVFGFTIHRAGNISVYGDFRVEHFPEKGSPYEVGYIKGIGVYTNIDKRFVKLRLTPDPRIPLTGGKLKITYFTTGETGKITTHAEGEMELKR